MMSILTSILECLTGGSSSDGSYTSAPTGSLTDPKREKPSQEQQTDEALAADILSILRTAEKTGPSLQHRLRAAVGTRSWSESIARAVLSGVLDLVQEGRETMGPAMAEALRTAEEAAHDAFQWGKDHPREVVAGLVIIVAVGILVVMMAPWIVEALGFAELGPVEGELS